MAILLSLVPGGQPAGAPLRVPGGLAAILLVAATLAGCEREPRPDALSPGVPPERVAAAAPAMGVSGQDENTRLAGTTWQLVSIVDMDDTLTKPEDPSRYVFAFGSDGVLYLRADCNRVRARWKSATEGQLEIAPGPSTRAACPADSLHDRILADLPAMRSYLIRGGHLFISLMMDGGIYELAPAPAGDAEAR